MSEDITLVRPERRNWALGISTRNYLVTDKTFEYLYRESVSQDRYVAHGLVSNGSAYLFLPRRHGRYLGGQWDIPGGTVEDGETSEAAAVRECFEETGLRAQCRELITHHVNSDTEGRDLTFHTMTYRLDWHVDETGTKLKTSEEEHDIAKWLTIDEALDLPLVWHVRQTLDFVRREGGNWTRGSVSDSDNRKGS